MQKNLLQDRVSVKYNRTELSDFNENEYGEDEMNVNGIQNEGNRFPIYNNNNNKNNNNINDNNDRIYTNKSINNYWNRKSDEIRSNFSELLPETQEFDKYGEHENEGEGREGREGGQRGGARGGRDDRQGSTARYRN